MRAWSRKHPEAELVGTSRSHGLERFDGDLEIGEVGFNLLQVEGIGEVGCWLVIDATRDEHEETNPRRSAYTDHAFFFPKVMVEPHPVMLPHEFKLGMRHSGGLDHVDDLHDAA